ncbi:MAG: hypothetical protein U5L09_11010 [Bacteroidales bacterium]|nr:hypothetical protein [Bacteroidales bacterium]
MQPLLGYTTDDGGESWNYRDVYTVFGTTAYEGTAYDAYFFNSQPAAAPAILLQADRQQTLCNTDAPKQR